MNRTAPGADASERPPSLSAENASPRWLEEYAFDLPPERIAREPVEPRDASRLLVIDRARPGDPAIETRFHDLPGLLAGGDLLVVNETRVLPARLLTRLERTGREVEILLSHPEGDAWRALLGPSRRLRAGDRLRLTAGDGAWEIVEGPREGAWRVRAVEGTAESMMERAGRVPLPPYLHRDDVARDREWYQTMFAHEPGAIAAPTAGLHFTPSLLGALAARGVGIARVVLHVGPGTFAPVRAATAEAHQVAAERFRVPVETRDAIAATRARGGRVIAVGTTTVRALETSVRHEGGTNEGSGAGGEVWTDLTIVPGFAFREVDALITNFHLPRSSLLVLVSAFAGRDLVLAAYRQAIASGFRFYSYGDAMLIL